jgi:hypothetical protein
MTMTMPKEKMGTVMIPFTPDEMNDICYYAWDKVTKSIKKRLKNSWSDSRQYAPDDPRRLRIDLIGIAGEMAASVALSTPYVYTEGVGRKADITMPNGLEVEVKATSRAVPTLVILEDRRGKNMPYVLVKVHFHGEFPNDFPVQGDVLGWIWGHDAFRLADEHGWWQQEEKQRITQIPVAYLEDISTLREIGGVV